MPATACEEKPCENLRQAARIEAGVEQAGELRGRPDWPASIAPEIGGVNAILAPSLKISAPSCCSRPNGRGARRSVPQWMGSILRSVGKVVVVGSTNTDMTVRVPHLPVPGETVGGGGFRVTGGGKGANQAVAAARAGASVVFVTALGTDDIGDRAFESLAAEAIDLRFVRRVADAPSGIALILVDDAGENVIAVAPGANAAL